MSKSINVMYVEDDEVDVLTLEREFSKVNPAFSIHVAKNGFDAFDKLLGRNGQERLDPTPRAILLDINLPKMDGIEFLTELRKHPEFKSTFVFIVTSTYTTKDKLAIRPLSVSGCIIKPLQHADALNIFWCITSDYPAADVLF
jgi:CheY-like chemotaxis protein